MTRTGQSKALDYLGQLHFPTEPSIGTRAQQRRTFGAIRRDQDEGVEDGRGSSMSSLYPCIGLAAADEESASKQPFPADAPIFVNRAEHSCLRA
jgi:hypothetical protein